MMIRGDWRRWKTEVMKIDLRMHEVEEVEENQVQEGICARQSLL